MVAGCGGETALHRACRNGYAEVVEVLLQHGADPYAKDSKGETSFDITVKMEHNEMLKVLLDHYVECIADSELSLKCLQLKDRILLEHRDLLKKELLEQQALLDDYNRGYRRPYTCVRMFTVRSSNFVKAASFLRQLTSTWPIQENFRCCGGKNNVKKLCYWC